MAAARYFIRTGNGEKGPYTVAQLREAVEQTAISASVDVRRDGKDEVEPLAALLRRTEPERQRALRQQNLVAGVDLSVDEGPPEDRARRAAEGDYGTGIVLGFLGGIIALALSFLAKPKTRQGIVMGFVAQVGVGIALRVALTLGSR